MPCARELRGDAVQVTSLSFFGFGNFWREFSNQAEPDLAWRRSPCQLWGDLIGLPTPSGKKDRKCDPSQVSRCEIPLTTALAASTPAPHPSSPPPSPANDLKSKEEHSCSCFVRYSSINNALNAVHHPFAFRPFRGWSLIIKELFSEGADVDLKVLQRVK